MCRCLTGAIFNNVFVGCLIGRMAGLRFAALRIRKECLPKRMLPYNWFMPENKPSDSDPARAQQPPKFLRYTSSHAPKPAPLNPSELPPVPTLPEQGLESFRSQFHDLMGKRTAKPRAGFNDEVMGLCDQTGRFVHRLIEKKNLCWPELPQVFLSGPPHEPLPVEVVAEIALTDAVERNSPYFDVWWHGLLDWIAEQIEEPTFIPDSRIAKYLQMARIHLEPPAIDLDSPAKKVLNVLGISNPDVTWPLICEASIPALAYLLRVLQSSQKLETSKSPKRKGAPRRYNSDKDGKWASAWNSRRYRTHRECAEGLGTTEKEFKKAIDRHRKQSS